ncbi:2876_t:CDS:2, partial [Acaulospora colombiana]
SMERFTLFWEILVSKARDEPTRRVQQQFTATQSIFTLKAGGIDLTATFLSPVEHSIPFSYLSLSAVSNDGASHSVQVYTDISAEWVSGDNGLLVNWSTKVEDPTAGIITHQVQLANEETFKEIGDHIQRETNLIRLANISILMTQGTTYQTGADTDVRAQFIQHGVLLNTTDSEFRAVQDRWPIFAYAKDLGDVGSGGVQNAVVFSVGHVRDPAIQYIVEGGGLQERGIASFHSDFTDALGRANTFDAKVKSDALSVSEHYAGIAALSVRQAFAATEITISRGAGGSWNTSDILIFMKGVCCVLYLQTTTDLLYRNIE